MKFHYHYCAKSTVRPETVIDGVVTCNERVLSMEQYRELKKVVCGDIIDPHSTYIMSLTLLGTDAESEAHESPSNS